MKALVVKSLSGEIDGVSIVNNDEADDKARQIVEALGPYQELRVVDIDPFEDLLALCVTERAITQIDDAARTVALPDGREYTVRATPTFAPAPRSSEDFDGTLDMNERRAVHPEEFEGGYAALWLVFVLAAALALALGLTDVLAALLAVVH